MLKKLFSAQKLGIIILVFSVLFLPMLHRHPATAHAHDNVSEHQHQSIVHADFFPEQPKRHDDHEHHHSDVDFSENSSHHSLSEINLFSFHITQSVQFSSRLKKQLIAFPQEIHQGSVYSALERRVVTRQAPSQKTRKFSLPSLRAPPYPS